MKKLLLLPFLLLSFAQAETFHCKVTEVINGNTINCLTEAKKQVKVRLYQIDSPESSQAYGQKAKQVLSDMIYGHTVKIENKGTDRYKRTLGVIYYIWTDNSCRINDPNLSCSPLTTDINREMVTQGYAWYYPFTKKNPEYQQAEQEAKAAKRGLWEDKHAVAPWEWRKSKRK